MGIVSKILGLAFAASGFFILWWGMGVAGSLSLVWSFVGMFVMAMGFALLTSGRQQKEEKPPPPTVTEIRCNSCDFKEIRDFQKGDYVLNLLEVTAVTPNLGDFKEIRDFQKGDYVLKAVETTCPKCQSAMTIEGVYIVREEPDEKDKI